MLTKRTDFLENAAKYLESTIGEALQCVVTML